MYTIEGFDADGRRVFIKTKNVVVQNFFTSVFTLLSGGSAALNITHFAVGSGTSTAAKTDTALQTETYRKAVSAITASATKLTVKTSIGASDFVGTWQEVGIIINGTDTLASGSLLSRANVSFNKTNAIQLLITYTLTCQ